MALKVEVGGWAMLNKSAMGWATASVKWSGPARRWRERDPGCGPRVAQSSGSSYSGLFWGRALTAKIG